MNADDGTTSQHNVLHAISGTPEFRTVLQSFRAELLRTHLWSPVKSPRVLVLMPLLANWRLHCLLLCDWWIPNWAVDHNQIRQRVLFGPAIVSRRSLWGAGACAPGYGRRAISAACFRSQPWKWGLANVVISDTSLEPSLVASSLGLMPMLACWRLHCLHLCDWWVSQLGNGPQSAQAARAFRAYNCVAALSLGSRRMCSRFWKASHLCCLLPKPAVEGGC